MSGDCERESVEECGAADGRRRVLQVQCLREKRQLAQRAAAAAFGGARNIKESHAAPGKVVAGRRIAAHDSQRGCVEQRLGRRDEVDPHQLANAREQHAIARIKRWRANVLPDVGTATTVVRCTKNPPL